MQDPPLRIQCMEDTMKPNRNFIFLFAGLLSAWAYGGQTVRFAERADRIDILFGGQLFSRYLFTDSLTKPVLFPVRFPSGAAATRGFPLALEPGESRDHPHHIGIFFTVDEVNGNGFWNNTSGLPKIRHLRTSFKKEGEGKGILSTVSEWIAKNGKALFREDRTMVFVPEKQRTRVDFFIRLTALDTTVTVHDTKEGMFAMRVADWLKEEGGSGRYMNSMGEESEKNVWGKRAAWVRLEGNLEGRPHGIVLMNHPSSTNFPAYWHARGYGLFSTDPLGQGVFEQARGNPDYAPFNLTLKPGESAPFRFRMILYEGRSEKKEWDAEFQSFSRQLPEEIR
jgi:hypothetical protein